ncbi:MAG: tetratricopeptide repeat protein [Deltaproteobacteria bacterium]
MKPIKIAISIGFLLIACYSVFGPALRNDFVNWDDDRFILENTSIRSTAYHNVKAVFTSFYTGHYEPFTMMAYMLEYHFSRLRPFLYHLTNLILHSLNCLLVFWLFYLTSGRISVALLTAALFGIHPLQVQTVAWASGTKNVLYSFFYLGALICYLYYLRNRFALKYYYGALGLFICALFSKSAAVTLPVILFGYDYFFYKRHDKKSVVEKIPFLILALVFAAVAVRGSQTQGVIREGSMRHISYMAMIPSYAFIFYLSKIFAPLKLSCLYHYAGTIEQSSYPLFFNSFLLVILLAAGVIASQRYTKKIAFGVFFYLATLAPTLQFIPIGEMLVAEHWAYIPSLGIFFIISEGIVALYARLKHLKLIRAVFLSGLAALICILALISRQRCFVWQDSLSLWTDVIANYPNTATAYNNRGAVLLEKKEYRKAYLDFVSAISIDPNFYEAYLNIGTFYSEKGNYGEAIKFINKSLQINPNYLKAYDTLVSLYGNMGRHADVIGVCKKIISIDPGYALAYANLCGAYGNTGDFEKAVASCRRALELDPDLGAAHMNLAAAYFELKQYDMAIRHCDEALKAGYGTCPKFLEALKTYRKQ